MSRAKNKVIPKERVLKAYISYDLSRKRFKEERHRKRKERKAKYYAGCAVEVDDKNQVYVKDFKGKGNYARWYKKYCNRRVRHMEVARNNGYRKATEYQWTID